MNEENSYNLVDEPWIPVLMQDGTNRRVSLCEVFSDADGNIADLALNPYERVAVFRLLLCIAQAALGPERLKDERAWRAAKPSVGPVSADYLKKWHDRFFLYGPHAFLQPDDATVSKPSKNKSPAPEEPDDIDGGFNSTVNKLCLERAAGSNSTLFDREALNPKREMADCNRAVSFLVFQSFSSGGRFSSCVWDGELSPANGSAFSAPCRESDMLFSILLGKCLQESLWLNLLTDVSLRAAKIQWGRPAWEYDKLIRVTSNEIAFSLLGHLVPVSRIVKLVRTDNRVIMGEGFVYPTLNPDKKSPGKRPFGWRESMATIKLSGEESPMYVSAEMERQPWRDLASILSVRGTVGHSSALSLKHIESLPDEKAFTLWVGGLCTDQAKDIGSVEWVACLSVDLLEDTKRQKLYKAIQWAERQESALYHACKAFALAMKTPDPTKQIQKSKEAELVQSSFVPAKKVYWDLLAQSENQKKVLDVNSGTFKDDWKKATREAAEDAYRRACPSTTARQMEAYAQGYSKLRVPDDSKKPETSNPAGETA